MEAPNNQPFPWRLFLCEMSGTAALVLVGLSFVVGMFGTGGPMTQLLPNEGLRRLITGFLFGTTGASIAFSAVGKESGAHINPAVTRVFWLFLVFIGFRLLRPFTRGIFPPLYAIMVYLEASVSGTSTNPARSLGPAVISGQWQGWWIYWVGPVIGAFLASLAYPPKPPMKSYG